MRKLIHEEEVWVSWLYVILWSVVIFMTIPFARTIESFVHNELGRSFFLYGVIAVFIIGFAATVISIRAPTNKIRGRKTWLFIVTLIFIGYTTYLRKIPEEAVHFLQYGFLGILIYRALTHHVHDRTIYFSAAVIAGIIGIVDEGIQWLTPGRYWGLRDIWINFVAAVLVQVGIAKGYNPPLISAKTNVGNLLLFCRLLTVGLVCLQLSFLNTPVRVLWYAERVPWLSFLNKNESVMLEYGYLYNDPEIGVLRSRFSLRELKQTDALRAIEAAAIIDQFQTRAAYGKFLQIYTPISDPFLHELRVHLFCRNLNLLIARQSVADKKKYTQFITRAFRENQILEKYFPETLKHSTYIWSRGMTAKIEQDIAAHMVYESAASRHLITRITELQLNGILFIVIIGLVSLQVYLAGTLKKNMKIIKP